MTSENSSAQRSGADSGNTRDEQRIQSDVERYAGLVWTLAKRSLSDEAEAALLVQAVFTDLWRDGGRPNDQPIDEVWVTMLTRARLIQQMTPADRQKLRESLPDDLSRLTDHMRVDLATLKPGSIEAHAGAALNQLEPATREALTLAVILSLSHHEIATGTQQSVDTVKRNVRSGLLMVCQALAAEKPTGATS